MTACSSAKKSQGTFTPISGCPKEPTKAHSKTAPAKPAGLQHGTPSTSLRAVTGGKAPSKTVVKNGAVVFADDKILAKAQPQAKQDPAKQAKIRGYIGDFGMIKIAKSTGKDMKRSIWGKTRIPTLPAGKR